MARKKAKKIRAKRKAKDIKGGLLDNVYKAIGDLAARVELIEHAFRPQLSKFDTPESVAEKAQQARVVMSEAAKAIEG
jgi:hypothetical protein